MAHLLPLRIDQLLPNFVRFDAIGSHTIHLRDLIRDRGIESDIFALNRDEGSIDESYPLSKHVNFSSSQSMVVYHHSIGCGIPSHLLLLPDYCVMSYHNVTPPAFFAESPHMRHHCIDGLKQLHLMRAVCHDTWSDSIFNQMELTTLGYAKGRVVPIVKDYGQLVNSQWDRELAHSLQKKRKTISFVGRIAANKCQHDLILAFSIYRKITNSAVRLVLVGKGDGQYRKELESLCSELSLSFVKGFDGGIDDKDVVFTGPIDDSQLAAVYRASDLFLCFSEHS